GGASVGYAAAGYDVTGVDINHQPDYPYSFVHGDALEYVKAHGHEYDLIHTSWPCPAYSLVTRGTLRGKTSHPRLIEPGREALNETGVPWVMENVMSAPLRADLWLCGDMFPGKLEVIRHRKFELSHGLSVPQPVHTRHRGLVTQYRHGVWQEGPYVRVSGHSERGSTLADVQRAMNIYWTDNRSQIVQAIPAEYTRYIGTSVAAQLAMERCASA